MGWLAKLFGAWFGITAIKPAIVNPPQVTKSILNITNRTAFLDTIAFSEGTYKIGDRGYNCLFGGTIFTSYADHPRKEIWIPRLKINTSAAGRYQIEKATFDRLKAKLGLKDFSPSSQDACAVELISEHYALADVDAGRFTLAVGKCAPEWASFPASKAGQPLTPIGSLMAAYAKAGGKYDDWRQV